jgi:hypothetical protein
MYQIIKDKYTELPSCIKRLSDNAFIPMDEANSDYQAFLKYQAEGGKVYAADEDVPNGQADQ